MLRETGLEVLTHWQAIHETLLNFGADNAAFGANIEHLLTEIEQSLAQVAEQHERLERRSESLDRRERSLEEAAEERRGLEEQVERLTAELHTAQCELADARCELARARDEFSRNRAGATTTATVPRYDASDSAVQVDSDGDSPNDGELDPVVENVLWQFARLEEEINQRRRVIAD